MWEVIEHDERSKGDRTERLKVPGGWIVRSHCAGVTGIAIAQTFVADPEYAWKLTKKKQPKSRFHYVSNLPPS